MKIEYINAKKQDASLLIDLYNRSFYSDYIKYGECPAYDNTKKEMQKSIEESPKQIIFYDDVPVGVISFQNRGNGEYYLGCLCVIPEYQGKRIGTQAVKHMISSCLDWRKITLITPSDKKENIEFYTEKCGFSIGKTMKDGNVEVIEFFMER